MSVLCNPSDLIKASACFNCIPPGMQGAVQAMLACEWAEGGSGGCDDPVVLDWLQRLADDFQPMPSADTIRAVCDFCIALRVDGIMDKMLVVNPIIPDSFLSMRYPLIYQVANGNSPFINFNFVAADLNNNGLIGNASTKYFNTGFNPLTQWGLDTTSAGMTVYQSVVEPAGGGFIDVGCDNGAADEFFQLSAFDGTNRGVGDCWDGASNIFGAAGDFPAFYCMSRTSNVLFTMRNANSVTPLQVIDTTNADQNLSSIPNVSVYFMSGNSNGVSVDNCGKRISFMAIHEGLTQSEVQSLYNAVYDLRVAFGGGYV